MLRATLWAMIVILAGAAVPMIAHSMIGHRGGGVAIPGGGCIPGDTPPAPASAAGLTCEAFRWGNSNGSVPADTAAEIAPANTSVYSSTYKWYPNNFMPGGGTFSVNGSGALTISPAVNTSEYYFNTCALNSSGFYTANAGNPAAVKGPYYAEATMTWNETGSGSHWGFYAYNSPVLPETTGLDEFELDFPDTQAFAMTTVHWAGGFGSPLGPAADGNDVVANSIAYGVLVTNSVVSFYRNGVLQGSTNFSGSGTSAAAVAGTFLCGGPFTGDTTRSVTLNSYTIWH